MEALRSSLVRHVLLPANLIVAALILFGVLAWTVEGDLRRVPANVDPDLPRPPPAASATADAGRRARLAVKVTHLRNASGKVLVWVYGKGPFQDGSNAVERKALPASAGEVTAVFEELPRGTYAVLAFHDENGNERLDFDRAGGPPAEGTGVSNAQVPLQGPPSFDAARFALDRDALEVEVPVFYP